MAAVRAGAELQGGDLFPGVAEAVDGGQFVGPPGAAQLVEHAAPADGLELAGVTHQHQSPSLRHGQADEVVDAAGAKHAGLVKDKR